MDEDDSSPFACRWFSWEVNPYRYPIKMQILNEEFGIPACRDSVRDQPEKSVLLHNTQLV